jgi:putative ABC transport system permease protein
MMLMRLLKRDALKKKVVLSIVFLFIMMSAFLAAAGTNLIVELLGSLDTLFRKARVPHVVQMHSGSVDRNEIEAWAADNELVQAVQTAEMITMDGSALYLEEGRGPEENSIMDISFVRQNEEFDFLLDTDNRIIQPKPGEIAVPVYYRQNRDIEIGDTVRIRDLPFEMDLTVSAFLRDAQMNPSIVHSKRFLVHMDDFARLQSRFPEREYLIEFRLNEPERVNKCTEQYLASGLPKRGPTVDYRLFKTLSGLTDGIVAAAIIGLSLLLMVIALLCLRFTLLATLEEDQEEIGVMKAIGMNTRAIKRIYAAKYIVIAAAASLAGYSGSYLLGRLFSGDMRLYIGSGSKGAAAYLAPFAAAVGIFLIAVLSCMWILRRISRISAAEALRTGTAPAKNGLEPKVPLHTRLPLNLNITLGLRDVVQRFRLFGLLCFVFFFCSCIIILPLHFLGTMTSPSFISYMGIGQSDLRIDLRQSESVQRRYAELLDHIEADKDVERHAPLVTSRFTMLTDSGEEETISVESGDFTRFPLDYVKGSAPKGNREIALSYLSSRDMEKQVGDSLVLLVDGQKKRMRVSGIYQDVTNGGRTAKASLPYNRDAVLWYTVCMDLVPGVDKGEKQRNYAELFHSARVTDMESYISKTLGNTIDQLRKVTAVAAALGIAVAVLITSLFLSMLIAKDAPRIAVMKSIGFSLRHLRTQYLSTATALLALGVLLGTLFSNTLGSRLVSLVWGQMGAPHISFVIDPLRSYLLLPALLFAAVATATVLSVGAVKNHTIRL